MRQGTELIDEPEAISGFDHEKSSSVIQMQSCTDSSSCLMQQKQEQSSSALIEIERIDEDAPFQPFGAVRQTSNFHPTVRTSNSDYTTQHFSVIDEVKHEENNDDVQPEPFVADESGNIVYEDSPEDRNVFKKTFVPMQTQLAAATSESRSIFKATQTASSSNSQISFN